MKFLPMTYQSRNGDRMKISLGPRSESNAMIWPPNEWRRSSLISPKRIRYHWYLQCLLCKFLRMPDFILTTDLLRWTQVLQLFLALTTPPRMLTEMWSLKNNMKTWRPRMHESSTIFLNSRRLSRNIKWRLERSKITTHAWLKELKILRKLARILRVKFRFKLRKLKV